MGPRPDDARERDGHVGTAYPAVEFVTALAAVERLGLSAQKLLYVKRVYGL